MRLVLQFTLPPLEVWYPSVSPTPVEVLGVSICCLQFTTLIGGHIHFTYRTMGFSDQLKVTVPPCLSAQCIFLQV